MKLDTTVGIIVAVLGLSGTVGMVIAVIRVNLSKTTLDLYKQDNDALRARNKTLEEDKADCERRLAEVEGKLKERDREIGTLRDMVTGTSAINRLASVMAGQHAQVVSMLRELVPRDVADRIQRERDVDREAFLDEERRRQGLT